MTCIPLHHNLADEPTLADGCPPGTRSEMPCIPLHKFGRWTYFGWTQWQRFESSNTHHFWDTPQHFLKTHLSRRKWLSFMPRAPEISASRFQGCWTWWQRFESSSIHHFWDTCQHFLKTYFCLWKCLSFVPSTRAEMTCITLHTTWKMNLLWLNTMAKVWKL